MACFDKEHGFLWNQWVRRYDPETWYLSRRYLERPMLSPELYGPIEYEYWHVEDYARRIVPGSAGCCRLRSIVAALNRCKGVSDE
jgi:hypothetical protein